MEAVTLSSLAPGIQGKTVLIIGGTSGIGKAVAKGVYAAGGTAWICSREREHVEEAKREISLSLPHGAAGSYGSVRGSVLDAGDPQRVKSFFQQEVEKGSIQHLVLTPGSTNPCIDIRGDEGLQGLKTEFDSKFFAQVTAVCFAASHALAEGGSIVLTSGSLSLRPGRGNAAHAAVNGAIEALGRALANDFSPSLRVNVISPGVTETEAWEKLPGREREETLEKYGKAMPLQRAGKAEEVAKGVLFLLDNAYVTGTVLQVDGGFAIRP